MNINLGDHQDLATPSNTNLIIGLILSVLITAATFFVCTSFVDMLKSEMAEVQKVLDDVNHKITQNAKLKKQRERFLNQKAELEKKNQAISLLESQQTGPVFVLSELTELVSQRVFFSSLELSGLSIVLEGKAIDNVTLADFLTRMENCVYFEEINLEESKSDKTDSVDLVAFKMLGTVRLPK